MRRAFALGVIALLLAAFQSTPSDATGSSGNLRVAFVGDTHGSASSKTRRWTMSICSAGRETCWAKPTSSSSTTKAR